MSASQDGPKPTRSGWLLFCLGVLVLLPSLSVRAQRGALVVHQNLAELVDQAETIVVGRVLSARAEKHPQFENLDTVVVTLKVSAVWKGAADSTFTFRQFVWDIRDAHSKLGYGKGGEVLLLMIKPSRYGLSSPAGLEQGRFRIVRDSRGNKLAVNGWNNLGLFKEMGRTLEKKVITLAPKLAAMVEQHRAGPLRLDSLRNLIRQLAGAN